jgi:hypothetical protein
MWLTVSVWFVVEDETVSCKSQLHEVLEGETFFKNDDVKWVKGMSSEYAAYLQARRWSWKWNEGEIEMALKVKWSRKWKCENKRERLKNYWWVTRWNLSVVKILRKVIYWDFHWSTMPKNDDIKREERMSSEYAADLQARGWSWKWNEGEIEMALKVKWRRK